MLVWGEEISLWLRPCVWRVEWVRREPWSGVGEEGALGWSWGHGRVWRMVRVVCWVRRAMGLGETGLGVVGSSRVAAVGDRGR